LIERIIAQIGHDYGYAPFILLKDPRICRLLPLYLAAFDILDIEPLVILQLRPFHEVARSLADRDGFDTDLSEFLWLRSIIEAEHVSRSCLRVWVTLDQAISDWHRTARRIAATLEINWTEAHEEATWESSLFIRPRLCHPTHQSRPRPDESRWLVSRVWSAVQHGLSGDDAGAQARFDELRLILQDLDRLQDLRHMAAWPLERAQANTRGYACGCVRFYIVAFDEAATHAQAAYEITIRGIRGVNFANSKHAEFGSSRMLSASSPSATKSGPRLPSCAKRAGKANLKLDATQ
jgi:hypothetical protein